MEAEGSKATLLAYARVAARDLGREATSPQARADACLELLADIGVDDRLEPFRKALHALRVDERHYWIGTIYTLMLPAKVRRSQATYFTPPAVADAVVDFAIEAGFDLSSDDVLDPAAGGAAFLSTIAGRMTSAGLGAREVAYRLNGIEIDVCAKNSNVKLNISSIGFYGTETKTVTVTVWDLTDGTSLATQEISAVAGSFVTAQTDIVVSIPRKTTRILITTPETSFYRVNTINGGCASCGGEFRRSMVTARGATIDTSVPKMHSNVQGASTTGGLSVIASLVCDHAQILCENKESIALPLLYKYGEEIIKRGLWNVQRMNTETLAREVLEQRLAEYAGQYRKTMDEVLMGMPLPTDTECFTCNSRTRVVQVIP